LLNSSIALIADLKLLFWMAAGEQIKEVKVSLDGEGFGFEVS